MINGGGPGSLNENLNENDLLNTHSGSSMFDSRNDMFGSSGVLGDANMSAWNDGESSDFGASIGASSNLTGSCNTFQKNK